ncbi:hypothetical protein G6F32_016876 [Rhizopus arrhizus]|nr:hypothetical protein G6F32_016876 [Rhizopus arrhizus]
MPINPNQNDGVAQNTRPSVEISASAQPLPRRAAITPSAMPPVKAKASADPISSSVAGRRSAITVETGLP